MLGMALADAECSRDDHKLTMMKVGKSIAAGDKINVSLLMKHNTPLFTPKFFMLYHAHAFNFFLNLFLYARIYLKMLFFILLLLFIQYVNQFNQ